MRLRDNLDLYTSLSSLDQAFVPSPMAGVERVMIDRVGDEVAVATSIVRYAPNSSFPAHAHALGEEFIVLAGEFADEHDRYPPMTYVRNPPGSAHTPFSDPGCTIFVKLRQFAADDLKQFQLKLREETPETGVVEDELHTHGFERVRLLRVAANERVALSASPQAQEAFVLRGTVSWQTDQTQTLAAGSWLRVPPGCPLRVHTLEPSLIFTKTRPKPL